MFTELQQLFDALTKGGQTEERRLMIDMLASRDSYKRFEITGIGYIRGDDNSSDGPIKFKRNGVLNEVFETGLMTRKAERWIDRFAIDAEPWNKTGVSIFNSAHYKLLMLEV